MKRRALLALIRQGPDEAAAAAVTAFTGDINAVPLVVESFVLHAAVMHGRPQTIAALAARGDCNPNIAPRCELPVLCSIVGSRGDPAHVATLLAHFPTLSVDACDSTGAAGFSPLHYAAYWDCDTNAQLLLDAGADPTIRSLEGITPAQFASRLHGRSRCTELLAAAEAWHAGLRQGWLRAVVGISKI